MEHQQKLKVLGLAIKTVLNTYPCDLGNVTKNYGSSIDGVKMLDIFQPFEILDGQCFGDYLLTDLIIVETILRGAKDLKK